MKKLCDSCNYHTEGRFMLQCNGKQCNGKRVEHNMCLSCTITCDIHTWSADVKVNTDKDDKLLLLIPCPMTLLSDKACGNSVNVKKIVARAKALNNPRVMKTGKKANAGQLAYNAAAEVVKLGAAHMENVWIAGKAKVTS
jgi:hypothetical protein